MNPVRRCIPVHTYTNYCSNDVSIKLNRRIDDPDDFLFKRQL